MFANPLPLWGGGQLQFISSLVGLNEMSRSSQISHFPDLHLHKDAGGAGWDQFTKSNCWELNEKFKCTEKIMFATSLP